VKDKLFEWLSQLSPRAKLVLYWAGHGQHNIIHYLALHDSPRPPRENRAMSALGGIAAGRSCA